MAKSKPRLLLVFFATASTPSVVLAQQTELITFSEFDVDTKITDQYADRGVIFEGDDPFITEDIDNPSSPVLSGTPQ